MAQIPFNSASATPDELGTRLLEEAGQKTPDLLKMKSLIDAGANIEIKDDKQNTPLLIAVEKQNVDAAALLIDNGADKYAKQGDATALFYAVAYYNLKMVSMLLDKGVDPERDTFKGGLTALMWAANLKKREIADEIARRGGDVNRVNPKSGMTAPGYAEDNNKKYIADSLRAIDADKKQQAIQDAINEKNRVEQERIAAEKAALHAVCDAGIPTIGAVKIMRPLSFAKPPIKT